MLEASGGGIGVKDEMELADRALHLLKHPAKARRLGRLAKKALLSHQGAARRHARVVSDVLLNRTATGQTARVQHKDEQINYNIL